MILLNFPYGVFVWSQDVDENSLIFRTKFQNYISEYLMTLEDCKKFRAVLNANYKELQKIVAIVNSWIKIKDNSYILNASLELFERWKNETFRQLDEYEVGFGKSLT